MVKIMENPLSKWKRFGGKTHHFRKPTISCRHGKFEDRIIEKNPASTRWRFAFNHFFYPFFNRGKKRSDLTKDMLTKMGGWFNHKVKKKLVNQFCCLWDFGSISFIQKTHLKLKYTLLGTSPCPLALLKMANSSNLIPMFFCTSELRICSLKLLEGAFTIKFPNISCLKENLPLQDVRWLFAQGLMRGQGPSELLTPWRKRMAY